MLWLYRFLHVLLIPLLFILMTVRTWRGREDKARFSERRGIASQPRPAGNLVWVHGASVGESFSSIPLLRKLRTLRPDTHLLLTTGTINGMKTLERVARLVQEQSPGASITTQYVPIDTPWATARFFQHWQPTLSVFLESDFWPELLTGAPHPILLNGRISDRSWKRYQPLSFFFTPLISRFEAALAQTENDADRLRQLGATNVQAVGNLKFDADPLMVDDEALDKLRGSLGHRPVVVFASTHPGEEEQAAQIHLSLKAKVPELLTIVVPRHPHRGTQATNEILRHLKGVHRRGVGDLPRMGGQNHTDIYVADTMGELGLFYRLADVAVVGGSLVPHGGQNPLEPLKLGVITATGPHMFNFRDMVPTLTEKQLLNVAAGPSELTQFLLKYLTDPPAILARQAHIAGTMPGLAGASATAAQLIADKLPLA